jgi:hypothetical protein
MTAKTEPTPLDLACYDWQDAKYAEAQANAERLDAERRIIAIVGAGPLRRRQSSTQ